MAGLARNLLTIALALPHYRSAAPLGTIASHFHVTPFDTGIATLKSDRYLQLAESAQVDFMVCTGLIGQTLGNGWQFVNAAQLVKFLLPVRLFHRVRVDTRILFADEKCAYFAHDFLVSGVPHAQVLVKMKFKNGRLTIPPATLLGGLPPGPKPEALQRWDAALDAINP
ncbi:MAG: thioesterase [Comamonadaceae bacterium]|nr:MAG: thioesterase [Comamonadaceae bacterium]